MGSKTNIYSSDDQYSSNTPFLTSGQYSDYLYASGFGFSLPTGSAVTGIQVDIERNDNSGKIKDNIVKLVIGGSITGKDKAVNAAWPSTDKIKSYGGATDVWGTGITYSDVNNSQFGVAISVIRTNGAGSNIGYIDHIKITVSYTTPLPVELIQFDATQNNNSVVMNWSTATEINNDHFDVERSADGYHFESIGTIAGAGNSVLTNYYNFVDLYPNQGANYYRLKQVDFDGTSVYSYVIAVEIGNSSSIISIFPNPATNQFFITNALGNIHSVEIINSLGQLTKTFTNTTSGLDVSDISPGNYYLILYSDNQQQTIQFTKVN